MIHSVAELSKSQLKGTVVFLRGSADVPMNDDKDIYDATRIKDTSRIDSFLPTLEKLVKSQARVVLQPGWIDRPDGVEKNKSVIPVYMYIKERLGEKGLLKHEMLFAPSELHGKIRNIADNFDIVKEKISSLEDGQVLVLENPRFDKQYNKGDEAYARTLAGMVEIYVADDFAQRHRPSSDIVPMPKHVDKRYAGLHLMEEIEHISQVTKELEKGKRKPFVFILAGKKIETKPGVVSKITVALKLLDRMKDIDKIVVGGAVAYTFMIASKYLEKVKAGPDGVHDISMGEIKKLIGDSYIVEDQIHEQVMLAGRVLLKARDRGISVLLPRDHLIMKNGRLKKGALKESTIIEKGWMGVDIGPQTIKEFEYAIKEAGFVVMSGPVGMFDKKIPQAARGSTAVAKALEEVTKNGVVTVSAGGESTLLVNTLGIKISHASIGGGSTLEFIEKGTLPGIEVLES
ncbi:MAG: phosphoglycerate kinase [Candidatus Aenigmatarchaeota archaeon]|nr:MAG: phosphoglycerate kinase [Candidatus Aenigmarchaeota archaeon]